DVDFVDRVGIGAPAHHDPRPVDGGPDRAVQLDRGSEVLQHRSLCLQLHRAAWSTPTVPTPGVRLNASICASVTRPTLSWRLDERLEGLKGARALSLRRAPATVAITRAPTRPMSRVATTAPRQ